MPVEFRSRFVSRSEAEERSSQTTKEELFKLAVTKEFRAWRKEKSEAERAARKRRTRIAAIALLVLSVCAASGVWFCLESGEAPGSVGPQGHFVLEEMQPPTTHPVEDAGESCGPVDGASYEPEDVRTAQKDDLDVLPLALERGQKDQGTITLDKRVFAIAVAAFAIILGVQACVVAAMWGGMTKVVSQQLESQVKLAALESQLRNQRTEIQERDAALAAKDAALAEREDDLRIKDAQIALLMANIREAGEQMRFQRQEIAIVTGDLRRARETIAWSEGYVLRLQEAARAGDHMSFEDEGRTAQ